MDAPSDYNYWNEPSDDEEPDLITAFIFYLLDMGGF